MNLCSYDKEWNWYAIKGPKLAITLITNLNICNVMRLFCSMKLVK